MIRNVVMARLGDPGQESQLAAALAGIAALELDGLLACQVGRDLGLRDGGWSFVLINDWRDPDAYRAYDIDAEHNRHRAAIVAVCPDIARVQYEVP